MESSNNNELSDSTNCNQVLESIIDVALDIYHVNIPTSLETDVEYIELQKNLIQLKQLDKEDATYFQICCSAVDEISKILLLSDVQNAALKKQLFKWMNLPHNQLPDYFLIDENDQEMIWKSIHLRSQTDQWYLISDIALRLLSIPASETSCERLISLQGFIAHKRSRRSNSELLDGRLIHMLAKVN